MKTLASVMSLIFLTNAYSKDKTTKFTWIKIHLDGTSIQISLPSYLKKSKKHGHTKFESADEGITLSAFTSVSRNADTPLTVEDWKSKVQSDQKRAHTFEGFAIEDLAENSFIYKGIRIIAQDTIHESSCITFMMTASWS